MDGQYRDDTYRPQEGRNVIYLAGGCFWGMQKLMTSIAGVTDTTCGYANGSAENPTYEQVCSGDTGARETVRVIYDPSKVSLDTLLYAFFSVIDPTQVDRQGNDVGSQYQTGIYFIDDEGGATAKRIAATERTRYGVCHVEVEPLKSFYVAADEHQDYLEKNPVGYCHIPDTSFSRMEALTVDPSPYVRPDDHEIWGMLTPTAFDVTQKQGTENRGSSDFWQSMDDGIYVDVVTGEPLFASSDKYLSDCGWPSFCRPIDPNVIRRRIDTSYGLKRTEITSRVGNSHLGHVFDDDDDSPSGIRYCVNGAALRFVSLDRMDAEGYGYLKDLVKVRADEPEEEPAKRRGFFRRRR